MYMYLQEESTFVANSWDGDFKLYMYFTHHHFKNTHKPQKEKKLIF